MVQELVQQGADPKQKDAQGLTAIDQAVLAGDLSLLSAVLMGYFQKTSQEVQECIEKNGPSATRQDLRNSLQYLSEIDVNNISSASKAAFKGDLKGLNLTSDDLVRNDFRGLSPLHYAVLGGSLKTVQFLIEEKGANSEALTALGDTLLHLAAFKGNDELISYLLTKGLNPNGKNNREQTPLHYAAVNDQLGAMEALIRQGANPAIQDQANRSPFSLVGAAAHQKDPLHLSKSQYALFLLSALSLVSSSSYFESYAMQSPISTACSYGLLATQVGLLMQNFSLETLDSSLAAGLLFTLAAPPFRGCRVIRSIVEVLTAPAIVASAFKGIKASWANRHRKCAALCNFAIHTFNAGNALHSLYQKCVTEGSVLLKWVRKNNAATDSGKQVAHSSPTGSHPTNEPSSTAESGSILNAILNPGSLNDVSVTIPTSKERPGIEREVHFGIKTSSDNPNVVGLRFAATTTDTRAGTRKTDAVNILVGAESTVEKIAPSGNQQIAPSSTQPLLA